MQIFTLKDKAQKSNRKRFFPFDIGRWSRERKEIKENVPFSIFFPWLFHSFSGKFWFYLSLHLSVLKLPFFSAKNGILNLHENGLQKILTAIDAVICKDQRKDFGIYGIYRGYLCSAKRRDTILHLSCQLFPDTSCHVLLKKMDNSTKLVWVLSGF